MARGVLGLFPVPLALETPQRFYSAATVEQLIGLRVFVCEELRTTRRFLSQMADVLGPVQALQLYELSEHTPPSVVAQLSQELLCHKVGLFSAAGMPILADPGAGFVAAAQRQHIPVQVYQFPSAPLMVLLGSGFCCNRFGFAGYLSIARKDLRQHLRKLARDALTAPQVFIETPYRNQRLLELLLTHLSPGLHLCLGANLGTPKQSIRTRTIAQWQTHLPNLHKQEVTFALGVLAE